MGILSNASKIVGAVAESEEFQGSSVFRTKDSVVQFNDIMDQIQRYSSTQFKYVAEAVKVQVMPDNNLIVEMDELEEFMDYNGIDSYVEAVNIVAEANGIQPGCLSISIDEEVMTNAYALAEACCKNKNKKKSKKCSGCGKGITECTCESYQEEVEPEIEMFDSLVSVIEDCQEAGVPIVLKVNEEEQYQDDDYTEEYEDGYEDDTVEEDTDLTNMPDDEYLNTVFSDIDEE